MRQTKSQTFIKGRRSGSRWEGLLTILLIMFIVTLIPVILSGPADAQVQVKDINPGGSGSFLTHFTNVNGTLFFSANDGTDGRELWMSDGTAAGTVQVKDINPGGSSSFPDDLTNVNGTLFFSANDGTDGDELWMSDGTAAGTVQVKDINPGGSSSPGHLTNVNGTLFFRADDGTDGFELWRSDGTAAGTVQVKDINPGVGDSDPSWFRNVNGTLFFRADGGTDGDELWKSDGTAAGTVQVKDINPGVGDSDPVHLRNVNGTLFFRADDGTDGDELWRSDGTAAGTVQVKDINPGGSSSLNNLTNVNGTLFFNADDGTDGSELWKSNGTAAGTVQVKDINPGVGISFPNALTNVNGTLFFSADDGTDGRELWKSDGTAAGTVKVKDINPGVGDSAPAFLTIVNGTLFFGADDGTDGRELWKSDGTAAGTVKVKDINPGGSSSPLHLTNVNGTLFFGADDGTDGYELWALRTAVSQEPCEITQITYTTGINTNTIGSINADGTLVAFHSSGNHTGGNADGNSEIFLYSATTGSITQLTNTTTVRNILRAFSADGLRLVIKSDNDYTGGNGDGSDELFLYDINANTFTQLTTTTGPLALFFETASINANGTWIVIEADDDLTGGNPDGNDEIFLYNTFTSTLSQITDTSESTPTSPGSNAYAEITADGSHIIFTSDRDLVTGTNTDGNREIFTYDITSSTFAQLTDTSGFNHNSISISADGMRIAFVSTGNITGQNGDGNTEIFLFDRNSLVFTQATNNTSVFGGVGFPDISADGMSIAFGSNRNETGKNPDHSGEVFLYDTASGATIQLTDFPDIITAGVQSNFPRINADGTRIHFYSSVEGINPDRNGELFLASCAEKADLSIEKTDDVDPVLAGGDVTYTIKVTNTGPFFAEDVVVTDTLPAGAEQLSGGIPTITDCPLVVKNVNGIVECNLGDMAPGDIKEFKITVETDEKCRGMIENNAIVTSSTPDPNQVNNSTQEDTLCTVLQSDLSIEKTDDVDPVIAGNNLVYTINVNNAGPDAAPNVVVTDTLQAGEQFVSANGTFSWTCNHANGIVTCTHNGNLSVGDAQPITITVNVLPETRGQLINNVNVKSDAYDPHEVDNFTEEDTQVNAMANVVLNAKIDNPDPVIAGEDIVYSLTAFNGGPSSAENMQIVDTLPANTVFVSATPSTGGSCVTPSPGFSGTVTCTWGGFTPPVPALDATRTVIMKVHVLPSTPDGTIITNVATTKSDTTDPTPGNNSKTSDTTVHTQAVLTVLKEAVHADPVVAGQDIITYVMAVTNSGPSDALNVVATDTLPSGPNSGVTFISTSGCALDPGSESGGIVTCSLGTIAAGDSKVFRITVSVDSSTIGDITNTVDVTWEDHTPGDNNAQATVDTLVTSVADLSITKTDDPDPVLPDNKLTYNVTVSNAGPSDALMDVVVTDTLPAEVDFLSTSGCDNDTNGVPTCNLGTIPVGTSKQYTINVKVKAGTGGSVITNTAEVESTGPSAKLTSTDPDTDNNTATEDTEVIGASALNEPGSLLIWPLIENNASTIVNIANTGEREVNLECYMVTRRAPDEVDQKRNFRIWLSPNQKFWWDTSNPRTTRTEWKGDIVVNSLPGFDKRTGYLFCFAIDENGYEKKYNFLKGDATIFDGEMAMNYNAIPLQAYNVEPDRRLLLDGIEYSAGTSEILFEGFAANAFGIVQGALAVADIDIDLVRSRQPEFDINLECNNEDEVHFSSHVHYKDFELYNLDTDLHLSTFDIGGSAAFQCRAVAGPWINPNNDEIIAPGAMWAVFIESANNMLWGGNVWHPVEGTAPLARSCVRLQGGPACPPYKLVSPTPLP